MINQWLKYLGASPRVLVFNFHHVLAKPDYLRPNDPDVRLFKTMLEWIGALFPIVDLQAAIDQLYAGDLRETVACISFDDGYQNNVECALPVLQTLEVPATFFLVSEALDYGIMWNDRLIEAIRRASSDTLTLPLPEGDQHWDISSQATRYIALQGVTQSCKYMAPEARDQFITTVERLCGVEQAPRMIMTRDQAIELAQAGMGVGAHARSHDVLITLSDEEAWNEISGVKSDLEGVLQQPVSLYAYPNGKPNIDFNDTHISFVKQAGYSAAFSTQWGSLTPQNNRFCIPRFLPWRKGRLGFSAAVMQAYFTNPKDQ